MKSYLPWVIFFSLGAVTYLGISMAIMNQLDNSFWGYLFALPFSTSGVGLLHTVLKFLFTR